MKLFRIALISVGTFLILLIAAYVVIKRAQESQGQLPVLFTLPQFEFTGRNGEPFSRDDFLDKISVVDFFFTNCPGPCPRMSARMAELYQLYASTEQVQFVSISVDPGRDSLSVLRDYAQRFGVTDQRWQFLRAPIEEVIDLYEKGFRLGGMLPADHSTKFILIDEKARIRGYYDSLDDISFSILKSHVRELARQLP